MLINHEITYDTVMKSSGVGGGGALAPPVLLIRWKPGQNPWKPGKKWRPILFDIIKWHPRFTEKHMNTFFGCRSKKSLHDHCGRKCVGKNCPKSFSGKFGDIRAKTLRSPKICLLLHPWWKGTSAPIDPHLQGRRGKCPAMPPFSGVRVHIILHALSLLVAADCSVSL